MKIVTSGPVQKLKASVFRHRKALGYVASLVVVYALSGFFLAPWLVKKNAIESVRANLNAELRLGKVAINPFVLSLRIDNLELDDPHEAPFARINQIYLNFQLSSLFRWALTFDEFRVDAPELFIARDDTGAVNVTFLAPRSDSNTAETADGEDASLIRVLIRDFTINQSVVNWSDQVPADPVSARFGPVNVNIADLNTLPDRGGQQDVVITTETEGTLSWSGNLHLNPLRSEGHASIKGSHFPLMSAYLRHEIGFDFIDGVADVELDYRVASRADGIFEARVDNFNLQLNDVLVGTFSAANGDDESANHEVLRLQLAALSGGTLHWPERDASIGSLAFADGLVSLQRDESGELNILPGMSRAPDEVQSDSTSIAPQPGAEWRVSLDRLAIDRLAFGMEDRFVQPTANIGIESLDLEITGISNAPDASFPTTISLLAGSGGTLKLDGAISVLPAPLVDVDVNVHQFPLAWAQPYIKSLADVSFDSGRLNFGGHLRSSSEDPMQLSGNLEIVEFLITETDEGSRLGSWDRFGADKVALSAGNNRLDISELRFDGPYADILIAADGSVNLGRIEKGGDSNQEEQDAKTVVDGESGAEAEVASAGMAITIGRVVIANAAADFEDESLPLPFIAKIAELNGDITTIATMSAEPSEVSLEGKVDEFGFVRVSGSVTPLDPALNTDLNVAFQNVEMPKFSAYTIPFAGREIASGKLDVSLGYKVTASELAGENKVVLRDFELGEKVEHPGAMSLPLGLAVALLKDAEGKIDIDLPVRGNVDDPEFRYGRVVLGALANLIVKIVASPFALLGRLVGADASDLEYITFIAGRADLTPPEMEKVAKLAEALTLRPELGLDIRGVVDRETDGLAIRTAGLDQLIEERISALSAGERADAMYAQQRTRVLEGLYGESGIATDAETALAELRSRFTSAVADGVEREPDNQFDAVAYSSELRRQLIEQRTLAEEELADLANARAANVRAAILDSDSSLETRVALGQSQAIEANDDEGIRMRVTISAGAEAED